MQCRFQAGKVLPVIHLGPARLLRRSCDLGKLWMGAQKGMTAKSPTLLAICRFIKVICLKKKMILVYYWLFCFEY